MDILREDLDAGRVDFSDVIDPDVPACAPMPPGEVLRAEWLEPLGLTAYRLAKEIDVPSTRIGAIIAGARAISADTALRLGRYFGTGAQFWLNLQTHYELTLAQQANGAEIERRVKPRAA